ncbi:HAD-IIA family hydrolase [Candidatus Acetothermia bacterium]|nr:HAD-IIA family hydrolase [Candidatus Acetothermia bacterium]MBI3460982.1 HAD-IIA family hydrolase [Candidatus Acetothermia bacterium]
MGRPKLNLENYRAFLVDLDGVLIRSFEVLPGAPQALEKLKKMGRVIIASNNSTRSRASFADGLQKLGFAVEPEMIVHSAYIIARYLLEQAGPSPVFILGEDGLREELELAGHRMADPDRAKFVIAGLDRALTYEKLSRALRALRHGARCLATNADPTFPTPTGQIPGAGAIVGALTGMGFSPIEILGKPSRIAFQIAMQAAGVQNPKECLVIGDRLETDILGAQRMGMDSVLVLTGVTAKEDLERSELQPTWLMESVAALVR